jgi:hypothetical protein
MLRLVWHTHNPGSGSSSGDSSSLPSLLFWGVCSENVFQKAEAECEIVVDVLPLVGLILQRKFATCFLV